MKDQCSTREVIEYAIATYQRVLLGELQKLPIRKTYNVFDDKVVAYLDMENVIELITKDMNEL